MAFRYGDFPCHRVVNHQGRNTPGWPEQVDLLKEEGVTFKNEFCVDLKKTSMEYIKANQRNFKFSDLLFYFKILSASS